MRIYSSTAFAQNINLRRQGGGKVRGDSGLTQSLSGKNHGFRFGTIEGTDGIRVSGIEMGQAPGPIGLDIMEAEDIEQAIGSTGLLVMEGQPEVKSAFNLMKAC